MEKANEIPASPWDILLLPVWIHKKLSVRLKGLVTAFLFVGFFDMVFFQNVVKAMFSEGRASEIAFKLLAFILLSFIIGAIDVICTMVPIADFAVMIGKRSDKYVSKNMPVILMKSYALSHIVFIIPSALYTYSGIDWENVSVASSPQIRLIFSILIIVMRYMPFIQLGILYRTLSVRTRIQIFGKFILILATYFWMQLSGGAILFFEALFQSMLK